MLRQLVRKAPDGSRTAARADLALDMVVKGRPRPARSVIEDEGRRGVSSFSLPGASGSGSSRMVKSRAP